MNNVIFLDIDGVLNSNCGNTHIQQELSNGQLVDSEKISILSELVKRTESKIVLHSGWRFWFDTALKPTNIESTQLIDMLQAENLKIYDTTPDFSTEEIKRTKKFSLVKATEILAWLDKHPEIDNWIVIDDLDLHNDIIYQHQIKTNPSIGLTLENIEQATKMLLH